MSDEAKKPQSYDIKDPAIREYMYLDYTAEMLVKKIQNLEFTEIGDDSEVPFTARVRSYRGVKDQDDASWLIKEIPEEEIYDHKLQEIAYYIDFMLNTLAAPNILKEIDGKFFRITKNIKSAMQISSYNYLQEPFKSVLAADLINRWLFFDEDRNPNNYLVLHDTDNSPKIVAIDYNKADLRSSEMKITGQEEKFGWHRLEKTRFLTLLKPENFDNLSIETFEPRLTALSELSEELIEYITLKSLEDNIFSKKASKEMAVLAAKNISFRKEYIISYFRKWFIEKNLNTEKEVDDRYAGFGQSFLDYYKGKQ